MGVPVFWYDLLLYVLVTLAVVMSVQTIGNILVLALLVTPAAAARLLTDRLGVMTVVSPVIGGLSALVGLYVSWSWDLPTGGTIVLVLTSVFLLAWLLAPRQGVMATLRRRTRRTGDPDALGVASAPAFPGFASAEDARDGASSSTTPSPKVAHRVVASGTSRGRAGRRDAPEILQEPPGAGAVGGAVVPGTDLVGEAPRRRWVLAATAGVLAVLAAGALVAAALAPSAAGAGTPKASTEPARETARPGPHRFDASTPVSELADPAWVTATSKATDIPERALAAYAGAALAVADTDPSCHLGWNTLAGIGQVESDHGTMNGSHIALDGTVTPTITGKPLKGDGVATVRDTDHGRLDGDTTWDHAVGPMQLIPSTGAAHAQDGDRDGGTDINQIDDAALTAAVYVCESGADLTVPGRWIEAIAAYNPDTDYNNRVAEAADRYVAVAPCLSRSSSPSRPEKLKRCSQWRTVLGLYLSSAAMAGTHCPDQLSSTIRACPAREYDSGSGLQLFWAGRWPARGLG